MRVFKNKLLPAVAAAAVFAAAFTSAEASRSRSSGPSEVDQFELDSWVVRALYLQDKLQIDVPMSRATFLHTHNSFNSSAYGDLFSYWIDPNHGYTIKEQLQMGARAIELDVHWYFAMHGAMWDWKMKPLLCHGQSNHFGCSSFDRDFSDGLKEIREYIENRPNRIIVIYLQNEWESHHGDVVSRIKSILGDYVYRNESGVCQKHPLDLTRRDVRLAGKNIIISANGSCKDGEFAEYVWQHQWHTDKKTTNDNFKAYPDCGYSKGLTQEYVNETMIRKYEDGTNLSGTFANDPMKASSIRNMLSCGINMPGIDHMEPDDGRLEAYVWSWSPNEPNDANGNEDCAEMWKDEGRWNDADCSKSRRFACKTAYATWVVTPGSGAWSDGHAACQAIGATFHPPRDGYENARLLEAKNAAGAGNLWLNASDSQVEGLFLISSAN